MMQSIPDCFTSFEVVKTLNHTSIQYSKNKRVVFKGFEELIEANWSLTLYINNKLMMQSIPACLISFEEVKTLNHTRYDKKK